MTEDTEKRLISLIENLTSESTGEYKEVIQMVADFDKKLDKLVDTTKRGSGVARLALFVSLVSLVSITAVAFAVYPLTEVLAFGGGLMAILGVIATVFSKIGIL